MFRYYPFVAGEYVPEGTEVLQITADPHLAATAPVGDSLLGDMGTVLEQLANSWRSRATGNRPAGIEQGLSGAPPGGDRAAVAQRRLRGAQHGQAR